MGNANVHNTSNATTAVEAVFESSLASDLQARFQAYIDALITAGEGAPDSINLYGAGDGHVFVLSALNRSGGSPPEAGTVVRMYSAASEPEFALAATAAIASLQGQDLEIIGQAEGGASQGRRWMGLLLAQPIPPPPPPP